MRKVPGVRSAPGPYEVMALSEQALRAQAACLRAKGYEQDARSVEAGLVEFDPDALENLEPNPDRESSG